MNRSANSKPQPTYAQQASQKNKKPTTLPTNSTSSQKSEISVPANGKMPSTTTASQAHNLSNGNIPASGKKHQAAVSIPKNVIKNAQSSTTIKFGSINQPNQPAVEPSPSNTPAPMIGSGIQSGGVAQSISNVLQFGTCPSPNTAAAITRPHMMDIPRTHSAPPQFTSQNPDTMNTHFTQGTTAAPVAVPHRPPTTHDFVTPSGHIATESPTGNANAPIHMHATSHQIPQPLPTSLPLHNQSHPQHPHYMPQNLNNPMNFYQPHHRNTPPYHNKPAGGNQQYAGIPAAYHYNPQPPRGPRDGKMPPSLQPSQPGSMPPQQAPYSTSPNTASAYPYNPQQPIGGGYQPMPFNPFPQPMAPQIRSSMSLKSSGEIKIPVSRKINIVNPNTNQVVDFSKDLPASTSFPAPSVSTPASIVAPKSTPSIVPVSTPSPRVSRAVPIVNPKELKPVQVEPTQQAKPKQNDVATSSSAKANEEVSAKPAAAVSSTEPSQEAKNITSSTIKVPENTAAKQSPSEIVEDQKMEGKTETTPAREEATPVDAKRDESVKPETIIEPAIAGKDGSSVLDTPAPALTTEAATPPTESGSHDVIVDESASTCDTVAVSEEGDTTADADELEEGEILEDAEDVRESEEKTEVPDVKKNRFPHGIDLSRSVSAPSMATVSPPEVTPTTPTVEGKLKYDRDFLLQFMDICREKPSNLQEMKTDQIYPQGGPPQRKGPNVVGPSGAKTAAYGAMGQFGFNKNVPKSSSQRFEESTQNRLAPRMGRSSSGSSILPPMMGNMMGMPPRPDDRRRTQNTRGGRDDRRGGGKQQGPQTTGLTIPIDQIVPLQISESRWVSRPSNVQTTADGKLLPEVVEKKVKGLLNKLTLEKFESISSQIIVIANQSEAEDDASSLKNVIRFIFEKATDEPGFSGMYAQLCKVMMEKLSNKIIDNGAINKDGKPITGGLLFRKCLLNRCQEDFEKGWKVEDGEAKPATSSAPGEEILTEEYYAAQKKKRRGLGLIQFIGELFKRNMLTENIMHHCVRRLLTNVESPEEEETESLCKLMTTIGRQIDHKEANSYVNTYIERMTLLSKNEDLPSRIRYMVQDVIDLRKDNWVPRRAVAAPKTIAQIHQDAAKAKVEAAHAEVLRRTASSGGRGMPNLSQQIGNSRRAPKVSTNTEGWTQVLPQKTGDLSDFGKISKTTPINLGPGGSSSLAAGSKGWNDKRQPEEKAPAMSRTSSQNKFSALEAVSTRRPSVDESQPSPSDRPRLNLLPKSSSEAPNAEPSTPTTKSPEDVRTTIQAMMKEFWNVRDTTIAIVIIREDIANPEFHVEIVEEFVVKAMEKKADDVKAVCQTLEGLRNDISADHFRQAFSNLNEMVDDLAIDAPQAPKYFGQMFASTGLPVSDIEEITKDLSPPLVTKIMEYART